MMGPYTPRATLLSRDLCKPRSEYKSFSLSCVCVCMCEAFLSCKSRAFG